MNKHFKELKESAGQLIFWSAFFAVFLLGYILIIENDLLKENDCEPISQVGTL